MIDQKDIGLVIGLISKMHNNVVLNKSFNQVLLREVSKLTGSKYDDLVKEAESLHAQYLLDYDKFWEELLATASKEDPSAPMTYADLIKMISGKK